MDRSPLERSSDHRTRLRSRLDAAVAAHPGPLATPLMVVDLDAFDANAGDLVRRAAGTPLRVASKSLRVPALLRRVLARDGFRGVLASTLAEALWLHEQGLADDVLVAHPTVDRGALTRLAASPSAAGAITLMVDDPAHLEVVDSVRSSRAVPVQVALDVDAGLSWRGQHVGPKRSPLHGTDEVVRLARAVAARRGFRLVGAMTYEGQVAGVPDDVPGARARSLVARRVKAASLRQLAERRREVADVLASELGEPLPLWNAGGSGSVAESAADPVVTEVAAGSGLLVPTLFDHYLSFTPRPASYFAVPVVRRPSAHVATVHGGGLVASGPAGDDRSPAPWARLAIDDLAWFRHAKSGEPFEHANTVHLLAGDRLVDEVPTYRGLGLAF